MLAVIRVQQQFLARMAILLSHLDVCGLESPLSSEHELKLVRELVPWQ